MTTRHPLQIIVGLAIVGVVIGATAAGAAPRELGWCFGSTWVTPSDLIDWWQRINEWTFIALAGAAMLPEAGLIGATGVVADAIEGARLVGGVVTGARMLWGSATGEDPVTHQPVSDFDRIMGIVPFLPHVAEGVFFGSGRGPAVEGETGVRPETERPPGESTSRDTIPGIGPERVWYPEEQRPPGRDIGQPSEEPAPIPGWKWDPNEQAWERVTPEEIGTTDTVPRDTIRDDIGTADTIPDGVTSEPSGYRELGPDDPLPDGSSYPPSRQDYVDQFRARFGPDAPVPEYGWVDETGHVVVAPGTRFAPPPPPPPPAPWEPPTSFRELTPEEAQQWVDVKLIQARGATSADHPEHVPIATPAYPENYEGEFRGFFGSEPDVPEYGWIDDKGNVFVSPSSDAGRRAWGRTSQELVTDEPDPADKAAATDDPSDPGDGSGSGSGGGAAFFFLAILSMAAGIWMGSFLSPTPALADVNEDAWDYLNCGGTVGGSAWGDPHIITFDGVYYRFMAAGEFVASSSTVDDFQVQLRMEPYPSSRAISVNTAVAANVAGDRVGVYATDEGMLLRVNDALTSLTGALDLPNGGRVELRGEQYAIVWPDGAEVHVAANRGRSLYLRVTVYLPATRRGEVAGLLGDFDTDPSNDIRSRGTGPTWKTQDLVFDVEDEFADSWRISKVESLFFYGPGESTEGFQLLDFPYVFIDLFDFSELDLDRARLVCTRAGVDREPFLSACMYDVGVTDDTGFAESGAALQAEVAESVAPFSLHTLDGVSFDLVVGGEFVLLESEGGLSDIQARFKAEFAGGSPGIVMTAIALNVQGERVTVMAGKDPPVHVNGAVVDFPESGLLRLPGGVEIQNPTWSVEVSWPDGTTLTIDTSDPESLEYNLSYPATRQGRWVGGLLGGYDGNSENDFRIRDGAIIPQPVETTPAFTARVNGEFADSWRVRDEERLFD